MNSDIRLPRVLGVVSLHDMNTFITSCVSACRHSGAMTKCFYAIILFSNQIRDVLSVCVCILGSVEEPRVLRLQTPCGSEHDGYCFNGMCFYAPDEGTPLCRCHATFSGERCEHIIILENSRQSRQEEVIGISVGVSLLLCCLIIALYCCLKKRSTTIKQSPWKLTRTVLTCTVLTHTVLNIYCTDTYCTKHILY
uniref:EGF-like domain-containing protein n=1 Tax=Denticeps clupeoides TaxID=299321 RepID=A0AAY4CJN7_9TELE